MKVVLQGFNMFCLLVYLFLKDSQLSVQQIDRVNPQLCTPCGLWIQKAGSQIYIENKDECNETKNDLARKIKQRLNLTI